VAAPVAAPVAAVVTAAPVANVELVPVKAAKKSTPIPRFNRRDAIMLVLGAGLLVTTGGLVWKIKRMLGEKPKTGDEQELEKAKER
jgi:hypothetical protein